MAKLYTKKANASFRKQTSSATYNEEQSDIQNDLYGIFDKLTAATNLLSKVNQNFVVNNIFQQTLIQETMRKIHDLEEKVNILEVADITGRYLDIKTSFPSDFSLGFINADSVDAQEIPAEIKVTEGFATLPSIKRVNKTNIVDLSGKEHVPKEIQFSITSPTNGELVYSDTTDILVNSVSRIWEAEIKYSDNTMYSPKEEIIQIEFNLPVDMMHEKRVNTIRINPYPSYGVEIANIELEVGRAYKQIPGFQQEDKMMGIREWRFENQYAERVRITLRQTTPIVLDNVIKYVFGIQHLDISYQEYSASEHYVMSRFDMKDEGIYSINEIKHEFLNDQLLTLDKWRENEIYTYELYVRQADGRFVVIPEAEWGDLTYEQIWIKTILKRDQQTLAPPCLHRVTLLYEKH